MRQRQPREHDGKHLEWVRSLPCLLCGDNTTVEAAHVRYGDLRYGKRDTGKGEKPDDIWSIPLCGRHHRDQSGAYERGSHTSAERNWWAVRGVDPLRVCQGITLARIKGDREEAELILEANRP